MKSFLSPESLPCILYFFQSYWPVLGQAFIISVLDCSRRPRPCLPSLQSDVCSLHLPPTEESLWKKKKKKKNKYCYFPAQNFWWLFTFFRMKFELLRILTVVLCFPLWSPLSALSNHLILCKGHATIFGVPRACQTLSHLRAVAQVLLLCLAKSDSGFTMKLWRHHLQEKPLNPGTWVKFHTLLQPSGFTSIVEIILLSWFVSLLPRLWSPRGQTACLNS